MVNRQARPSACALTSKYRKLCSRSLAMSCPWLPAKGAYAGHVAVAASEWICSSADAGCDQQHPVRLTSPSHCRIAEAAMAGGRRFRRSFRPSAPAGRGRGACLRSNSRFGAIKRLIMPGGPTGRSARRRSVAGELGFEPRQTDLYPDYLKLFCSYYKYLHNILGACGAKRSFCAVHLSISSCITFDLPLVVFLIN